MGVVVGAEGLEVTEMRKTGSFDMRVAQEKVEGGGLYYNQPYFVVLMLADTNGPDADGVLHLISAYSKSLVLHYTVRTLGTTAALMCPSRYH